MLIRTLYVMVLTLTTAGPAAADEFYLADGAGFPGQLWRANAGQGSSQGIETLLRRESTPNPAYPNAVMKLGQVAVDAAGQVYYVSGLDGSLMTLLDGRNEIQSFEFPGQIRDVACTGEEHVVYFSVVPTPQNGAALADGAIYRRDLWDAQPTQVLSVRQQDVGGNWWGTFTIREGAVYVATLDTPSRLYRVTTAGSEPVFSDNTHSIRGLSVGSDGSFCFTDNSQSVYRTSDFRNVEVALQAGRAVSDAATKAPAGSTGP